MSNLYLDDRGNLIAIGVENRDVTFRNFSGINNTKYPNPDNKQFALFIRDNDFAQELLDHNWPLRTWTPKVDYDPDVQETYYLPVKVKFRNKFGEPVANPPRITFVARGVVTEVGEDVCTAKAGNDFSEMDITRFEEINLRIHLGYNKDFDKYTAYLSSFDGRLVPDPLVDARNAWVENNGAE